MDGGGEAAACNDGAGWWGAAPAATTDVVSLANSSSSILSRAGVNLCREYLGASTLVFLICAVGRHIFNPMIVYASSDEVNDCQHICYLE